MDRAANENRAKAAAILMGGKAVRMNGRAKYGLKDCSGVPYICLQMDALSGFDRVYLSAASEGQLREAETILSAGPDVKPDLIGITDSSLFPDAGPLGGLYAVLLAVERHNGNSMGWLFAAACDMPGLTSEVPEKMGSYLNESYDCVICQDRKGRIHPLCGYYSCRMLPDIRKMLEKKDYRMTNLLIRSRCKIVSVEELGLSDSIFENMNTPEDLQKHQKKAKIFCICGVKNSGKTTYIERLVQALTKKGKKVAVIKHDGHDFEGDRPGTDTYRHYAAGAYGTAVFSSARYMVNKVQAQTDVQQLVRLFPEADVILIEGMKESNFPKIELIRSGISDQISCNRENLKAVVTDLKKDFRDTAVWSFEDIDEVLKVIDI